MKRLVIEVSNDLARELERVARDASETVEAVAARALREGLPKCTQTASRAGSSSVGLPTFTPPKDAQGLVEGRSWDDLVKWQALLDEVEGTGRSL